MFEQSILFFVSKMLSVVGNLRETARYVLRIFENHKVEYWLEVSAVMKTEYVYLSNVIFIFLSTIIFQVTILQ